MNNMFFNTEATLPIITGESSRAINAENPKGERGAGGKTASGLGVGRKGTPCITLKAGETAEIADIEGCGVINHIWITVTDKTSEADRFVLRDLVFRMYWDGEETPSVECPLGDFFLNGFARGCSVNSLPMAVNPNRGMNCFLPMPFASHAKITLENQHAGDIPGFFYQVDAVLTDSIPENAARFHAQWRREKITQLKRDYVLLDNVRGRGHYIGTYLGISALERYWWGEGEMKFYIDGDGEFPSQCSTGTEDYFGGSYGFGNDIYLNRYQTFSGLYTGLYAILGDTKEMYNHQKRFMLYRWHVKDPVYFDEDFKMTIDNLGWTGPRYDDYTSVAYWYQTEPKPVPFTLPEDKELIME